MSYLDDLKKINTVVIENEKMSEHTTFRIGGSAQIFLEIGNTDSLIKSIKILKREQLPFMIVGKGSNLLVSDQGIAGAVIHLADEFDDIHVNDNRIICGSGVPMGRLCKTARDNSLSGLEFAYGIPGSVGGGAYMNAGAYGGELKDVITKCRYIDENGEENELSGDELNFSYRHSAFSGTKNIITFVELELKKDNQEAITARMADYMNRRKTKQPLEFPSAGSVFKRPEGHFVGAMVEESGLKGTSVGGAQVSEKHGGFIINRGNATCQDVLALISKIQDEIKTKYNVDLECEIKKVGR